MCSSCESGGKPIAAVWWRVSTQSQTETSPDTQIEEAKLLLESKGYQIDDDRIIGADWHSLSILECPQMETLLSWVRHSKVHAIGLYHGDRLAGNPGQKAYLVDFCERQGVKLMAKHSPILEGKEGELIEYIRTWGKEQQVLRAQQASKDGLRDRARLKGLPPCAQAPYGFEFPETGGKKDYTRLVATHNWPVARHIWQLALEGVSMRGVVRELYAKGIPTKQGKKLWAVQVIHGILHNPVYAGRYYALRRRAVEPKKRRATTYGRSSQEWKPMEDWVHLPNVVVEQPVTTWDEYTEVQSRLEANKRFSRRNAKNMYLMRGLVHCETHDRTFHGRPRGNTGGFNYVCPVVANKLAPVERCARKSVGGPKIETLVWERAVSLLTQPELILGELERRRQAKDETVDGVSTARDRAEKRLTANGHAEMELVTLRIRGDVSEDIYQRQKRLLMAEKTWLTEELSRLETQLKQTETEFVSVEQVKALSERLGDKLDRAGYEDKRLVLEALETRVSIDPEGSMAVSFSIPTQDAALSYTPGRGLW